MVPYPRAAWRLAPYSALADVVLWFSQILIRHADATNEVSFNLAQWFSVPPPATRSRDEALALAQQIAQYAAADPARFPELARRHSEDLPRREEGGSMGGVQATHLWTWPEILDVLAALAPGQTSQVVETHYGFHIFYRSAPPPEAVLSGAHIVIGHDRAQWLGFFARAERPSRSREDALAVALDVYARARSEPERFAELVNQFSEHRDARDAGDFGAWSTREPIAYAPRRKRLEELEIGEVGAPIETHLGFEIIQRTALRPRQQFRAKLLFLSAPALHTGPPSKEPSERVAQAAALAQSLARDPSRIEELPFRVSIHQWEDGRGIPGLSAVVAELRPGQVASSPVETEHGLVIVQRLEPEPVVQKTFATELPAPAEPDVEHFLAGLGVGDSQALLRAMAQRAREQLALSSAAAERLNALHEVQERIDEHTRLEARLGLFRSIFHDTQRLLGAQDYARYRAQWNRHVRDMLLGAPADSLRP